VGVVMVTLFCNFAIFRDAAHHTGLSATAELLVNTSSTVVKTDIFHDCAIAAIVHIYAIDAMCLEFGVGQHAQA